MSNRSIKAVTVDLQDDNHKHHYSTPCRTEDDFPEAFELEKVSNPGANQSNQYHITSVNSDMENLLDNNYIKSMNKLDITSDKEDITSNKELDDEDVNVDLDPTPRANNKL